MNVADKKNTLSTASLGILPIAKRMIFGIITVIHMRFT
jgi:hypothetical protein